MRRLTVIALAVCVGLLTGQFHATAAPRPKPPKQVEVTNFPDPQNVTGAVEVTNLSMASRFQLVGFTSTSFTGDGGVLNLTLECQKEFPDSRMCTSVEVMETVLVPAGLSGVAWVRPSLSPTSTGSAADASGVDSNPTNLSCGGWRVTGTSGLRVTGAGQFGVVACSNFQFVACCALVP